MLTCNNCGSTGVLLWTIKSFQIFRCINKNCNLIFSDVKPEDIYSGYEKNYYLNEYPDYESDKVIHLKNNNILLDEIEKYYPKGKLIEIGSAFGFFLSAAISRNWQVEGFEISEYASKLAVDKYKLPVRNEDFLSAELNGKYDLVVMLDTIEHLLNPDLFIEKISKITQPGSGLVITTGDINSLYSKIFGKKWRLIAPPMHIYYYNPCSVTYLLNKFGLDVLSISHPSKYFNLGSAIQYLFKINKSKERIVPIKINLGDVMLVIARKK